MAAKQGDPGGGQGGGGKKKPAKKAARRRRRRSSAIAGSKDSAAGYLRVRGAVAAWRVPGTEGGSWLKSNSARGGNCWTSPVHGTDAGPSATFGTFLDVV